ncbi:MAG: ABC transporter permease [Planctomycetota bacterium]|nr:ABC transporter permease [Planctomycetota bacterium]
MVSVLVLNLKRFIRSPYLPVSVIVLILIAIFVLLLPAVSETAQMRLSIESFFFLSTLFLAFIGALFASKTLSSDRRSGTISLLITRPLRSSSLVLGTFFAVSIVITAISLLSFPLVRFILPLSNLQLKTPSLSLFALHTRSLYSRTHYALSFIPAGCPLINCAEACRIFSSPADETRKRQILWLDQDEPSILWFFHTDKPAKSLLLSAVVAHSDCTKARLSVIHNESSILNEEILIQDETRQEIPLNNLKGRIVVALSLLRESEPVGFRLWLDEAGYETTGAMLVTAEERLTISLLLCLLITALKATTLVAFGIFCSSFLSPAVSSILATFILFLSSANQFILKSATVLPTYLHAHTRPSFYNPFYAAVRKIVESVCSITPSLTRYSPELLLSKGYGISNQFLLNAFSHYLPYIPVLLVLSIILVALFSRRAEEAG